MPPEHRVHKDLHGDLGTDTIRPGEHLEGTETMKQETVPGTEGAHVGRCVRAWLLSWVLKDTKGFTGQNEEQGLEVSPEATSANTWGRRAPGGWRNSCRSEW